MTLNIPRIARKLNKLAPGHPIGSLQDIRAQLKKLNRRPGNKIFSVHTTFDDWAFHHGGRKELQFNIGYADGDKNDDLRHGVAFSFELSQTLKSIDVLVPKVKFFESLASPPGLFTFSGLVQGFESLAARLAVRLAEHVQGDAVVDVLPGADPLDRLLHLAVATVAPLYGVGG